MTEPSVALAQNVIYVDADAMGATDGTSWADAFVFLQDALALAHDGDEIWVAQGIYRPDQGGGINPGDRGAAFFVSGGVSLFGGFQGGESDRNNRDWVAYKTVLSGDLLGNDSINAGLDDPLRRDNARQLVVARYASDDIQIDGFELTAANLDERETWRCCGAAIYVDYEGGSTATVTLSNVLVRDNTSRAAAVSVHGARPGSGWSLVMSNASVEDNLGENSAGLYSEGARILVMDSAFRRNRALGASALESYDSEVFIGRTTVSGNITKDGSTVHARGDHTGNLSIWSSKFVGNVATGSGPGAVSLDESHLTVANCVFAGNRTPGNGGALGLYDYTAVILNSVFADNEAGSSGGAVESADRQSSLIANTIFWNNSALHSPAIYSWGIDTVRVFNSILYGEAGDLDIDEGSFVPSDPLFVDPAGADGLVGTEDDDFSLRAGSPAIDAGDNAFLPPDSLDLDADGDSTEPLPIDILGAPRAWDAVAGVPGGSIDIGAYEYGASQSGMERGSSVGDMRDIPTAARLVTYPNPATHTARISLPRDTAGYELLLYDMLGRQVARRHDSDARHTTAITLDVSDLAPGMYLLLESLSRRTGILVRSTK